MGYKKPTKDGVKPSLDLFMILGNILVDKDPIIYENHIKNELFESVYSNYMVIRYLSMNSNSNVRRIVLDNMSILEGLADHPELAYKFLMKVIPKTYNRFTPYIKSGFNTSKKVEKSL